MSEIKMNRTKNTVKASAYLPGGAYKCALALVSAYDGKIVKSADNLFRAKFTDVETAEKFKNEWTASYASAHAAYTQKPREGKGDAKWKKAVDKFAGKGKSANSAVSAILKDLGFTGTWGSPEWDYWMSIR